MAAEYRAWLVLDVFDADLRDLVLRNLDHRDGVNWDDRPRVSLRREGDVAVLCLADEDELFGKLTRRGERVTAISSAPFADVEFFRGKIFQTRRGRFRIAADRNNEDPYARRLLTFEFFQAGVEPGSRSLDYTRIDAWEPDPPNLFIEPQLRELSAREVASLFDGPSPLASGFEGGFFLPPCRTAESTEVTESYFAENLRDVRHQLNELLGDTDPAREPACACACRLTDEPLLRDILLDGGAIMIEGQEAKPTHLHVHVSGGQRPGCNYRRGFLLAPREVVGPWWASELAEAVRGDILALSGPGLCLIDPAPPNGNWICPSQDYGLHSGEGPAYGSWQDLLDLERQMPEQETRNAFHGKVMLAGAPNASWAMADSALTEKLFLEYCWRRPWAGNGGSPRDTDDTFDPWHYAMLEMTAPEFRGRQLEAVERIRIWNENRKDDIRFICDPRSSPLWVRYTSLPSVEEKTTWRLLLPLGTIVGAATICLDHQVRSILDAEFVLA